MIAYTELVLTSLQPPFRLSVSTDTRQMHHPLQVPTLFVQKLHNSFIVLMLTDKTSSDSVTDRPKYPAKTLAGRASQATGLVKKSPSEVTRRSTPSANVYIQRKGLWCNSPPPHTRYKSIFDKFRTYFSRLLHLFLTKHTNYEITPLNATMSAESLLVPASRWQFLSHLTSHQSIHLFRLHITNAALYDHKIR